MERTSPDGGNEYASPQDIASCEEVATVHAQPQYMTAEDIADLYAVPDKDPNMTVMVENDLYAAPEIHLGQIETKNDNEMSSTAHTQHQSDPMSDDNPADLYAVPNKDPNRTIMVENDLYSTVK